MRTHHNDTIPTAHKKLKPYNYLRIKRLSRMSGKSVEEVKKIFDEEYAVLKPQHDAKNDNKETRYIDDSLFDRTLLSTLYNNVMSKLGIVSDFISTSRVHGFNLERAEKYLTDIGYSKKFTEDLKKSPKITLIHYPKYLDDKYKKTFEYYFEKKILRKNYQVEHPIIFYARTLASFITHLYDTGKNPFSKIVVEAKTLPLASLKTLYSYKLEVLLRYVKTFQGFSIDKVVNQKENFSQGKDVISDFIAYGDILLGSKQFKEKINQIKIGKKLEAGKKLYFKSAKGVDLIVFKNKNNIVLRYRIKLTTQFRTYGIKDVRLWIKKFVIDSANHKLK